jgi:DNA helicase II / ATP-dependent DNA helicase PcrA
MELITDLHIHSHFSRATSKDCNLEELYKWGKIKGINIIGTGDFTHPGWFKELQEKLDPAENGLFKLKEEIAKQVDPQIPLSCQNNIIRFILTSEISNIYSKNGKVRKLHNLIVSPSFQAVSTINARLEKIGNLKADGRPILGLDSKLLLQISLESDPKNFFIPAHIWTPWFGMFGSKSGFDSIQEAFEDLAPEIKAVESGLSSDPFMNWRVSSLDNITIISNSDAHSPPKLGREANIINCEINYDEIINAIKTNDNRFRGTIEFFPQEGKYHFDGHRVCGIKLTPAETRANNGICPVCRKTVTVGVQYRVDELADKDEKFSPENPKIVEYIIPLAEIIAQVKGTKSTNSKVVVKEYNRAIAALGDEFSILRKISTNEIKSKEFETLAISIHKMRNKEIFIDPGYDGVYGVIRIL